MVKERFLKIVKICERAEKEIPEIKENNIFGDRMHRLMDLESADQQFNLRLDEFLNADSDNFLHDVVGIWKESNRETFPATFGLFVPRFAEDR